MELKWVEINYLNFSGLMDCLLERAGDMFKKQTPITGLKNIQIMQNT